MTRISCHFDLVDSKHNFIRDVFCRSMRNRVELGSLAAIDVLVLCGGLGTRLRDAVPDRPKGMALVGGIPFLDILVDDLVKQGIRRVIFCVGHLKEQIIDRFRKRDDAKFVFSEEDSPLGTGGAVLNAMPLIRSNPVLVMNGDSFCRIELDRFYQYHFDKAATATLVLTTPEGRHDGGFVCLDKAHQILSFTEKVIPRATELFINAGIYFLQTEAIRLLSAAPPFSLEHDVLPALVKKKPCFGFLVGSPLVDIGTPERYRKADESFST